MTDIKINIPSERQLLAELTLAFPELGAKPLRRCDWENYGVTFCGPFTMPDGQPIYVIPADVDNEEPDTHPGYIHGGFQRWLEERGWYVECYDYGIYDIVPIGYVGQWDNDVHAAYSAAIAKAIAEGLTA